MNHGNCLGVCPAYRGCEHFRLNGFTPRHVDRDHVGAGTGRGVCHPASEDAVDADHDSIPGLEDVD